MAHAGGQQLAVSDVDTAPDELEFEVVEAPVHGELIKTDGNTKIRMTNGKVQHKQKLGHLLKKKEYFCGLKNVVIVSFFVLTSSFSLLV